MNDYEQIVLCAVRYALGRRTYIVKTVYDYVANEINCENVTESFLKILIRDINDQEPFGYGDDCDKENWLKLKEIAQEGLNRIKRFEIENMLADGKRSDNNG